jgi:hypothetical protein
MERRDEVDAECLTGGLTGMIVAPGRNAIEDRWWRQVITDYLA